MKQPTIQEAIDFILKNRKGNAFKGYSEDTIAQLLSETADTSTILTASNDNEEIVGVVCAIPYPRFKKLYIHDILTTEKWVLPEFVSYFLTNFSGWSLEAQRRNKIVEYNTMKLTDKLLKKEKV